MRCQLQLANLRLTKNVNLNDVTYETYDTISEYSRKKYFPTVEDHTNIITSNSIILSEIVFTVGMVFVTSIGNEDLPSFGQIEEIFVKEKSVFFLIKPFVSISFNEHYFAYNVKSLNNLLLVSADKLPNASTLIVTKNVL